MKTVTIVNESYAHTTCSSVGHVWQPIKSGFLKNDARAELFWHLRDIKDVYEYTYRMTDTRLLL